MIDLAKLRARAAQPKVWESLGTMVDDDELLALIDAVEAAHAYEPQPDEWSNGDQREALREALARFDFGEPG